MPLMPPVKDDQANDRQASFFQQIQERFGRVSMEVRMMAHAPAFAQEMVDNQRQYLHDGLGFLDLAQREAICLAVSSANGCVNCVKAHYHKCLDAGWSEEQTATFLGFEAQLAMQITWHNLRESMADAKTQDESEMPMRMRAIEQVGIDVGLAALIGLAVAGVRSCPVLIQRYVEQARSAGMSTDQIDEAVYVAAVMSSYNHFFRIQH